MKFEIDPNELTTDQRAHVAAFITGWPTSYGSHNTKIRRFTSVLSEEQRLDAEQKEDLGPIGDANLNAIFGTPTATEHTKVDSLVPLDKEGLPWDSRIHSSSKTTIADGSWKLRRGVDSTEVEKVKAQLKELMAVPKFTDLTSELMNVTFNTPNADNEVAQALVDAARVPVPPVRIAEEMVAQRTDRVALVNEMVAAGVKLPEHLMMQATVASPMPPASVPTDDNIGWGLKSDGIPKRYPPAPKSHYLIDQPPVDVPSPAPVTLTDLIGRMSAAIAAGKLTQANVTEMCVKHGVSEFFLLGNRPDLFPLIDADMKAIGV